MSERLIFVSCGQLTDAEKRLGHAVQEAIDSHSGFKAYFAESVQSLATLGNHVFDGLRRSSCAVVLLHARDEGRSSMWINQELAVLAYRQYFESAEIPILVFKEESVKLEGAMTAFIVNAKPLAGEDAVIAEVHRWLTDKAAIGRPDEQTLFTRKWAELQREDRMILKAVIDEGGQRAKEFSIRRRLVEDHHKEKNTASNILRERRLKLSQENLVHLYRNINDGDEISLHPAWEWYVRYEISKWQGQ